jgi:predicted permease
MLEARIKAMFSWRREDEEFSDEIREHLDLLTEENVRRGMPLAEAQREAKIRLGGAAQLRETHHELTGIPFLETLFQDVRYALRMLRKSPAFAVVAVLTLALGIGTNTAIFSLVNAVLLRPLSGIANPNQIVSMFRMQANDPFSVMGYPDYKDYRDRSQSFSGLAAHCATWMNLGSGTPERIMGDMVTGNYFSVLGVRPVFGRMIIAEDDKTQDGSPVVVLSYSLWQQKFGASHGILGSTINLNGYPFTVIGVAPRQFIGVLAGVPADVWVPMSMLNEAMPSAAGQHYFDERAWGWLRVFGRLRPAVSPEQAQAEMQTIARQLALAYPNTNTGRTVALEHGVGIDPDDRASLSDFLGLLFAAVGLLLVIACANVAGLLLVRATGRQREIAIRLALGADRLRLIRQLVTEGLFVSLLSGALGFILAPWTIAIAVHYAQPASVLRDSNITPDAGVLVFTLIISLLAGVAFALLPAWRASSTDVLKSLKEGTPSNRRTQSLLHQMLAAAQVGASFLLLIAAGLLFHDMHRILNADPGYRTTNIFPAYIDLTEQRYQEADNGALGALRNAEGESVAAGRAELFYRQILGRLGRLPQALSASLSTSVPPNPWPGGVSVFHPGEEPPQQVLRGHEFQLGVRVNIVTASPDFFATMGIPLMQGRDFTWEDDANAPGRAIVSRNLAERMWPGEDAIGKRISLPSLVGAPRPPLEVVGVAADCKYRSLTGPAPLILYVPLSQNYSGRVTIAMHTALPPGVVAAELRREVAALDKTLPIFEMKTMQEHVASSVWQQKMASSLIGAFGMLAVFLATLGLYGVIAHSVSRCTHEIGIRMALGAQPGQVLRMVVREGMLLTATGVAGGIVAALGLTRFMASLLFGISPTDPLTFAAVTILLMSIALAACYIPARRAMRVDPMTALRYE